MIAAHLLFHHLHGIVPEKGENNPSQVRKHPGTCSSPFGEGCAYRHMEWKCLVLIRTPSSFWSPFPVLFGRRFSAFSCPALSGLKLGSSAWCKECGLQGKQILVQPQLTDSCSQGQSQPYREVLSQSESEIFLDQQISTPTTDLWFNTHINIRFIICIIKLTANHANFS